MDQLVNRAPPQFPEHRSHMITPRESGNDASPEINNFLDARLQRCWAVTPDSQTIPDMGEHESLNEKLPGAFWELVAQSGDSDKHNVATPNNDAYMSIPWQMRVHCDSQNFDAVGGKNFVVAKRNRETLEPRVPKFGTGVQCNMVFKNFEKLGGPKIRGVKILDFPKNFIFIISGRIMSK